MFERIMIPVDLAHVSQLGKALEAAADLAIHYRIPVTYVGVTAAVPGAVAHNPAEYAQRLDAFARSEAAAHGHEVTSRAYLSHDPTTDLDATLLRAVDETGADLVVMASHIPNIADHLWPSNGGTIATHSQASVFIVR
ncbi:MAG: universal stress protein [Thermohalobaculum sp.]|nr:universal stress protein [Thermohalobaculum sp.]